MLTISASPKLAEVTGAVSCSTPRSNVDLISAQNETHGLACLIINWSPTVTLYSISIPNPSTPTTLYNRANSSCIIWR